MSTNNYKGGRKWSNLRMHNGETTPHIRYYHWKKDGYTWRFCLERQKKTKNLEISFRFGRQSSTDRPSTLIKQL